MTPAQRDIIATYLAELGVECPDLRAVILTGRLDRIQAIVDDFGNGQDWGAFRRKVVPRVPAGRVP